MKKAVMSIIALCAIAVVGAFSAVALGGGGWHPPGTTETHPGTTPTHPDTTPTHPTDTTPTHPTDTTPDHPPTTTEPPRVCPDGKPPTPGEEAYDPHDDCARPPKTVTTPPPTVTTPPPVTTTTPPPTTPTTPPDTTPPPKPPKPPKPKPPVPCGQAKRCSPPKPPKPPHGDPVCKTLKDGTKRRWYDGANGIAPGCYPIIPGQG